MTIREEMRDPWPNLIASEHIACRRWAVNGYSRLKYRSASNRRLQGKSRFSSSIQFTTMWSSLRLDVVAAGFSMRKRLPSGATS
jgi:hypothetical protein